MIDLNKLRSDALKATQGEWYSIANSWENCTVYSNGNTVARVEIDPDVSEDTQPELEAVMQADASHIANNSPSTTLALVAVVEAAQKFVAARDLQVALETQAALREALKPFQKEAA